MQQNIILRCLLLLDRADISTNEMANAIRRGMKTFV